MQHHFTLLKIMEGGRWWWAWELISLRCKICGNSFTHLDDPAATLTCRKTADVHFLSSGNSPLKTLGTILDSILSISSIPSSEKSYPLQWSSIIWWKHSKILVSEQHVIRFKDKSPFCSWKMSAATRAGGWWGQIQKCPRHRRPMMPRASWPVLPALSWSLK